MHDWAGDLDPEAATYAGESHLFPCLRCEPLASHMETSQSNACHTNHTSNLQPFSYILSNPCNRGHQKHHSGSLSAHLSQTVAPSGNSSLLGIDFTKRPNETQCQPQAVFHCKGTALKLQKSNELSTLLNLPSLRVGQKTSQCKKSN